jgi:hypothetical protein
MVCQKSCFSYYYPMPLHSLTVPDLRPLDRKSEGKAVLCGNGEMQGMSPGACKDTFSVELLQKLSHIGAEGNARRPSMSALSHHRIRETWWLCQCGKNTPYEECSVRGMPWACKLTYNGAYCRGTPEDTEHSCKHLYDMPPSA